MKIIDVPIVQIQTHWNLNRVRDDMHVIALARHINAHGFNANYPIQLVKLGDAQLHLAAGHHRLAAAAGEHLRHEDGGYQRDMTFKNLPLETVPAVITLGDFNEEAKESQAFRKPGRL